MKINLHVTSLACALLIFGTVGIAVIVSAAEKKSSSSSPHATASPEVSPTASAAARPFPFHGMVSAVDHTAKTFTIAGKQSPHVFKVSDKTAITKSGKTATIKDIAENQEVSGSYWKNTDGTLEAKTVKLGPIEKTRAPAASPSPSAKASASPKP
jgi:hypothetical protein